MLVIFTALIISINLNSKDVCLKCVNESNTLIFGKSIESEDVSNNKPQYTHFFIKTKVEPQYWKFLNLSFVLYYYENNSFLYFYCNWVESQVQVSYSGVSYNKNVRFSYDAPGCSTSLITVDK